MIEINVGGIRYTAALATLQRDPESMLARMFADRWAPSAPNDSKLEPQSLAAACSCNATNCSCCAASACRSAHTPSVFIDRDGRHFHYILNFLRDGCRLVLPDDRQTLLELMNEVEFYQLYGLKELLLNRIEQHYSLSTTRIKVNEMVCWRQDAIQYYWRPFAQSIIHGIQEGFLYDKVGKKYNDVETMAACIGCRRHLNLNLITVFDYKLRFDEWEPLMHHMRHMRGVVNELSGDTCCLVEWANGQVLHVPLTAVIPASADHSGDLFLELTTTSSSKYNRNSGTNINNRSSIISSSSTQTMSGLNDSTTSEKQQMMLTLLEN